MPIHVALSCIAAGSALLAIASEWNQTRRKSFYLIKPLTTALIIAVALATPDATELYRQWIVAALAFSLLGDVCLMFSGERAFAAGLTAFLLAHLAFANAFLLGLAEVSLPDWLILVALYGAALLWWLLPRAGRLKLPVLAYTIVLGGMIVTAAARHATLTSDETRLALAGALLFGLSDSFLAFRQFVRPFRHSQAAILSTYWGAIGFIAWSI